LNIHKSNWHRELECFKAIKSTFILEGNIYDIYPFPEETQQGEHYMYVELDEYIYRLLKNDGYENVVYYNLLDGFFNKFSSGDTGAFRLLSEGKFQKGQNINNQRSLQSRQPDCIIAKPDEAGRIIRTVLSNNQSSVAIILQYASRYIQNPENLDEIERNTFLNLLSGSLNATSVLVDGKKRIKNLLFVFTDKVNDLPAWFYLNNPYAKIIRLSNPDKRSRRHYIDSNIIDFTPVDSYSATEIEKQKEKFVGLTDGFRNLELKALKNLSRQENVGLERIQDVISMYKYGFRDNPWKEINESKLKDAENYITGRVKGQSQAVIHTLDIIKRAVTGFSGLQHSALSSKPKGILFFAGPTGTGKTEMAKTLANVLFEDDNACLRFDMSEYQQAHSDQKLLGAPPGYVGYEAGGQLTNAIKEKPFSILLFDEIEKAHHSILDKFLQILEDGRMTDGQGNTVYFSESIIIFTSNLGIYSRDKATGQLVKRVSADMPYEKVQKEVIKGIHDYFNLELGRPEILNRLGNNIVVFGFITKEAAEQIVQMQLEKITKLAYTNNKLSIIFNPSVFDFLMLKAFENIDNGGRGIGNIIEHCLLNPLSRFIFDNGVKEGSEIEILGFDTKEGLLSLNCVVTNA